MSEAGNMLVSDDVRVQRRQGQGSEELRGALGPSSTNLHFVEGKRQLW
jgi:hypothetical protein